MSIEMIGVALAAATALSGAVLYVVRAESMREVVRIDGRLDSHEAACTERQKKLDERYEQQTVHLANIERKLDRLLESRS